MPPSYQPIKFRPFHLDLLFLTDVDTAAVTVTVAAGVMVGVTVFVTVTVTAFVSVAVTAVTVAVAIAVTIAVNIAVTVKLTVTVTVGASSSGSIQLIVHVCTGGTQCYSSAVMLSCCYFHHHVQILQRHHNSNRDNTDVPVPKYFRGLYCPSLMLSHRNSRSVRYAVAHLQRVVHLVWCQAYLSVNAH